MPGSGLPDRGARIGLLIFLVAWAHGLLWASVVPAWQAPDEPFHFEYACLLSETGRLLTPADTSAPLQSAIIRSMAEHRFWQRLGGATPAPLPATFAAAEDFWLSRAGTQVSDEPPLYYVLPALLCRWLPTIGWQLWAMRAYSAALSATVVLLGWLTARELWPERRALQLAVAAWLGFQPMAAFIGASANNDALVNLGGAALAFCLVRGTRRGWNWRQLVVLLALASLLPLSKKSGLFGLVLAAIVIAREVHRQLPSRRRWLVMLTVALGVLAVAVWSLWPLPGQAAGWGRRGTFRYDARTASTAHSGDWSLTTPEVAPGHTAWLVQTLPGSLVVDQAGQEVVLTLWTRAEEPTSLRMTIDDGASESAELIVAELEWQRFELRHQVAASAERLRVLLDPLGEADVSPAVFYDDISLRGGEGELGRNGSAESPKRRWEGWTAGYLRLPAWFGQGLLDPASYSVASLRRYGFYAAVTFGNFWADFGWLTLPFPVWVYMLPGLASLGAAIGLCWTRSLLPERWQRKAVLVMALQVYLVSLATALPMVGRSWQPQGRYLFPALVPLAILFTLGWSTLGQRLRWRSWWLIPALGMAVWDAAALFCLVVPYYYG